MQKARPAPVSTTQRTSLFWLVDLVQRLLQAAEHVGGDGVHDLLMVELQRCDLCVDVERGSV